MVSLLERSCHQNYKQYIVAVVVVAVAIVTTVVVVEAAVVVVVVVVVEVVAAVAVVCAAWRKATTSVGETARRHQTHLLLPFTFPTNYQLRDELISF